MNQSFKFKRSKLDRSWRVYTTWPVFSYIGTVKQADPSGPPHVRHGGWDAQHVAGQHAFGFTSRRAAATWLTGFGK